MCRSHACHHMRWQSVDRPNETKRALGRRRQPGRMPAPQYYLSSSSSRLFLREFFVSLPTVPLAAENVPMAHRMHRKSIQPELIRLEWNHQAAPEATVSVTPASIFRSDLPMLLKRPRQPRKATKRIHPEPTAGAVTYQAAIAPRQRMVPAMTARVPLIVIVLKLENAAKLTPAAGNAVGKRRA